MTYDLSSLILNQKSLFFIWFKSNIHSNFFTEELCPEEEKEKGPEGRSEQEDLASLQRQSEYRWRNHRQ